MLFRIMAKPSPTINFEEYLNINYYLHVILKIKKVVIRFVCKKISNMLTNSEFIFF